jgi:tRNA(Ile)-lysidine synthetase-like protein
MNPDHIHWPPPGRYILAVSGGADSMVLLDIMAAAATQRTYELVVAHFDHGLRPDSAADRVFVQTAADRYSLAFEAHQAHLGQASEAAARTARHTWLERIRRTHHAAAIITAHHQDDLIETSLLNLARGAGRRGLAPMQDGAILRPFLNLTRAQLRNYAAAHHLAWREDPTNADLANPRNFLRHRLLSSADSQWRSRYRELVERLSRLNQAADQSLSSLLQSAPASPTAYAFPRQAIRDLSLPELEELFMMAARQLQPDIGLDRRIIQELALFAKTSRPHHHRPLRQGLNVVVETATVRLYYMGISKVGKI